MAGFELERFEWTAPDRLEVVGRWHGVRGRRFLRPTLDVEVDGERRRMLALLDHKPWAPADGEDWVAAFSWRGDQSQFDDAELTVSPDIAVQLPTPNGGVAKSRRKKAGPAVELREARPPRAALLQGELAAAVAEVERLTEELERVRKAHTSAVDELHSRLDAEQARAVRLEGEVRAADERVADAERQVDEMRQERDVAAAASESASAEAERARRERDAALQRHAAGNKERDALREARDSARDERNAWMSRARAASVQAPRRARVPAPAAPARQPDAVRPRAAWRRSRARAARSPTPSPRPRRARAGSPPGRAAHDPDRGAARTPRQTANGPAPAVSGGETVPRGVGPRLVVIAVAARACRGDSCFSSQEAF